MIPDSIKKLAQKVRIEIYGRDVRESIAQSMEVSGETSNEANERSKDTATRQTDVENRFDDQIAGNTDIDEVIDARRPEDGEAYPTLRKRLDDEHKEVTTQLAHDVELIGSNVSAYWTPPIQPPARIDNDGYFVDGFAGDANKYINELWEPLRESNNKYIQKESLGKDQSNTYDIWKYEFTPKNYEKTMILGAALHGGEVLGMLGLYRFLYHVVNDWRKYPQLAYIRHKVRLIVLPIQNPWGVSQSPRTRQNSRGVDLNRNFAYNWELYPTKKPFDHDYKGVAADSEIETKYIRRTLQKYSEATTYLDIHALGAGSKHHAVFYTPKNQDSLGSILQDIAKQMIPEDATYKWGQTSDPSAFNYANHYLNIHSSNPEFPPVVWSNSALSAVDITKAVEWYGNIILAHSKLQKKVRQSFVREPFIKRLTYTHDYEDPLTIVGDKSYKNLERLAIKFPIESPGLLRVSGEVVIKGTDETSQNFILPKLGQERTIHPPNTQRGTWWEVYGEGRHRQTMPFSADMRVVPTFDGGAGEVEVGLLSKATAGEVTIWRYHCTIEFIPTEKINVIQEITF